MILPRPGEPLDVRTLYLEEATTNARRAHAPTRTSLAVGAESEVSFARTSTRSRRATGGAGRRSKSVVLRLELTGSGRVDVYRSKADRRANHRRRRRGRSARTTTRRGRSSSRSSSTPFEDGGWIWFDITTDTEVTLHSAGWYAPTDAPGRANVAVGIPTFNRPDRLRQGAGRADVGPVGRRGDQRGHRSGPGHQQGQGRARLRRGRRGTRRPADHPQPAEPRWLRRLQPGDVRGAEEHRLPNRSCSWTTTSAIEPDSILRALAMERFAKVADARRRPDAQPAGAAATCT